MPAWISPRKMSMSPDATSGRSAHAALRCQRELLEDDHAIGFVVGWGLVMLPTTALLVGAYWAPIALIPPALRLTSRFRAWQRLALDEDMRVSIRPLLDARDRDDVRPFADVSSMNIRMLRWLRRLTVDVIMVCAGCWALARWLRPWEQSRLVQQLWNYSPMIMLAGAVVALGLTLADRDARRRPPLEALRRRIGYSWRQFLRAFV